jgi:CRP-like cAMP-binding protein/sugar phosphate permease
MALASEPIRPSPFAVFRNRNFTLFWTAQLVSTIGSSLTSLAASILVFRETGSALSVGLMLIATAAPSVVFGLIAGVYVDRLDRKRIMIAADVVRAVLVVLIPFVIGSNLALLYVIVALTSAIGKFFDPAFESVLPEVASDEDLAAANSLMAISSFGSTAIGFAASGLIASRFPIEWAFYLDGLTFLVSAGCLLFVRVPQLNVEGRATAAVVWRNLIEGARFLFDTPILRSLLIISVPAIISFGLWNSLLLPFAIRALNATEFEYGVQEALTSLGFVAGSFAMARYADRFREGQWIALSYLAMGLVGGLYSQAGSIQFATVLVTISGFLNAPGSIARRLVIQRNTPREVRGRVNSAFFVSRDVMFLVGMGAAGLADLVDVRTMVLVSALLLIGSGLLTLFMPGLGRTAAEWRRAVGLLRALPAAPVMETGRPAALADFDRLAGHLPSFATLSLEERAEFVENARVIEAAAGTPVIREGEINDSVYFILEGRTVAGTAAEDGRYRSLSRMNPGDFFGEIAALTGSPRTADVAAEEEATLLQVPAKAFRPLMGHPELNRLFLTTMTERLMRTYITDMPRFAGLDEESAQSLRTPDEGDSGN